MSLMEAIDTLPASLLRDALFGAGMSVWEWHVPSDQLSNVDTSAALLGYPQGELVSSQAAWNEIIHPDDRPGNDAAYQRHVRGALPLYEHEYRARAKDGQWRWVSERGRIVEWADDGSPLRMVGTLADVTLRRRAQEDALELGERLSRIGRHVPGMVFQFERRRDGSSRFAYVSDSCEALTGLPPQSLVADATAFLQLVPRDERGGLLGSIVHSARTLRPWRFTYRIRHPDGERWLTGSATPQNQADGSVLWHGYIEDTTDLHELDRARRAALAAEAASAAKTAFLSRVSHELRTPLNAVLGFAQLLQIDPEQPLTAQQARRVGLIREAGRHLLDMIGDLLDLTQVEAGKLEVQLADVVPDALVAECIALLSPQAVAAGVALQHVPGDAALRVRADPTRLRQVLLNLLSNAVKYNRRGGWVRIGCAADGAEAVFEVTDSGVGIAAADLPHLFEPFDRMSHSGSQIEGAGIGLAITHRLVELMHGRIAVQSQTEVGTTFRVVLPRP